MYELMKQVSGIGVTRRLSMKMEDHKPLYEQIYRQILKLSFTEMNRFSPK